MSTQSLNFIQIIINKSHVYKLTNHKLTNYMFTTESESQMKVNLQMKDKKKPAEAGYKWGKNVIKNPLFRTYFLVLSKRYYPSQFHQFEQ
jgi:hypothetical protein